MEKREGMERLEMRREASERKLGKKRERVEGLEEGKTEEFSFTGD